jgi:hypothetical protein
MPHPWQFHGWAAANSPWHVDRSQRNRRVLVTSFQCRQIYAYGSRSFTPAKLLGPSASRPTRETATGGASSSAPGPSTPLLVPSGREAQVGMTILKGQRELNSRESVNVPGRVARTIVFNFTLEGAPSKLRLGGDFPRLNVSARSGKCQGACVAAPSIATRFPVHRSRRLHSDGNLQGALVNVASQSECRDPSSAGFALRRPALPQDDSGK